jgi:hypothetical protein
MSRDNITSVMPAGRDRIRVTFLCKNGEERTYEYEGLDAARFIAGADPAYLHGTRVDGKYSGGSVMDAVELAEVLAEIAL